MAKLLSVTLDQWHDDQDYSGGNREGPACWAELLPARALPARARPAYSAMDRRRRQTHAAAARLPRRGQLPLPPRGPSRQRRRARADRSVAAVERRAVDGHGGAPAKG